MRVQCTKQPAISGRSLKPAPVLVSNDMLLVRLSFSHGHVANFFAFLYFLTCTSRRSRTTRSTEKMGCACVEDRRVTVSPCF